MRWLTPFLRRKNPLCCVLIACAMACGLSTAHAQIPAASVNYARIQNAYLVLDVGISGTFEGTFNLYTSPVFTADPSDPILNGDTLASNIQGTKVFVRVDGGINAPSGFDYRFGDQATGTWLEAPTVVGTHVEARWQTQMVTHTISATGIGTGTGTTTAAAGNLNQQIEVDLVASLVHDSARFQFTVINNGIGQAHTVGLAFTQDLNTNFNGALIGAPLRPSTGAYLHTETLLQGSQIPRLFDLYLQGAASATSTISRSMRGTLEPPTSGESEPTPPSRFAFGTASKLNGTDPTVLPLGLNYDTIWNFTPSPTVRLDTSGSPESATTVFWDPQVSLPAQQTTYVTYFGLPTSDSDFTSPLSLSVSGPIALGLAVDHTNPAKPVYTVTPNPFLISAAVQNVTDLSQSGGIGIGPINLVLSLPPGLQLNPATGDTATKQIANVSPGAEQSVSWSVVPVTNVAAQTSGTLQYIVAATPNVGNGKQVQRTIQVPSPPSLFLKGDPTALGLFEFVSIPLSTGTSLASQVLGLPETSFDLVQYDPVTGHYVPVSTFTTGQGYWIRSHMSQDTNVLISGVNTQPLANQVEPNATPYQVSYPVGWNQIGDPFVYSIQFSEIQVFNTQTLQIVNINTAGDPTHLWILPAVYYYNTSDPNPQNWAYVLQDNLGFMMQPYVGYWLLVKTPSLQFIYPGADTPGGSVTRAALLGVGLGATQAPVANNNWKLRLTARGASSSDLTNYIGVAPNASDTLDNFKFDKPPTLSNHVSLDIVHTDWKNTSGHYAEDLRSPQYARKEWDLVVTGAKPNEDVTLAWPEISSSVPRGYALTLTDTDTNTSRSMKTSSSYTINTGTSGTRHIQIVAQPARSVGRAVITNFAVTSPLHRGVGLPSVTISYTLSEPADTQVTILNGAGRTIRTIATRAVSDGATATGSVVWDLRDQRGIALPAGVYNIQLDALSADGQHSRQIQPYLFTR